MIETVAVALAGRSYAVVIGRGLIEQAAARLRPFLSHPRVAVVMDDHVEACLGRRLLDGLESDGIAALPIVIAPGEGAKSFAGLEALSDRLLDFGLERGDLVVAFGGGVVGDLAGFAAAIYKRGIDFAQMPTTLLAQVDSSVGGKTAIDTPRGKNMIGAFHQPRIVLADLGALDTLPDREMRCGFAEIIKYGLLGDRQFFDWLATNTQAVVARDSAALPHAVRRSIEMKAEIVALDERERGARALLNLGHTFGHAVEAEMGFGDGLKHGEAVGLGCAMAFRFSSRLGVCSVDESRRAVAVIAAAGLPTGLDQIEGGSFGADRLITHMTQDKKARGGRLVLILVRAIGEAFVAADVDAASLRAFLIDEGARA